ncbi:manganese efflux pump [Pseudaminobacter soli (ex Li et al. 2025)]|uniref:Sporulation membrane protein YtaF n=1 Tax=Pseudaminobacter soli (ex Li et al. 2025) TaxID=1295366 RepID=A0A2P7RVN5_9HYPH|nr:manganese efflux pump [Mesorhizobium soli]PSJ54266.1 sporulation membrane protein YtaF [Mesorhizobium soli]
MDWLFITGLAIASSIDNLAVGLSYGVRGIRIGLGANLIIAVICFVLSEAGILFGEWIGAVLPGDLPDIVGAVLLFLIGVRILLLVLPREKSAAGSAKSRGIAGWFSRVLAVENGRIGFVEALVLGVALSANALANAVGAGLLHMPSFAIALSASIGSLVTISLGVALGLRATHISIGRFDLGRFGTLISGMILVGLAIGQIW